MGCCSSYSKYKKKDKLDRKSSKDVDEEEQKDQEKFHRASTDGNITIPDKTVTPKKEPETKNPEEPQVLITENSRRNSEYNMHRTLESSVKKLPNADMESPRMDRQDRFNTEESTVKITKDQHDLLLKFVDERLINLNNNIIRVFENLSQNNREDERLPFLMEEIKGATRDIENSMDDLKSHAFYNSEELINTLERNSELVKKINFAYSMFRKNLKNYKETRDQIIEMLKLHNPSIADTRTTDYTSANGTRGVIMQSNINPEEKESGIFIPRDDTNCSDLAQEKDNMFDFGFESRPATGGGGGEHVLPRLSNISSRRGSGNHLDSMASLPERKENAAIVHRNISQIFDALDPIYEDIVKSVNHLERQLQEIKMKKVRDSISIPVLNEKFRYESENTRKKINPTRQELDSLIWQTEKAFETYKFDENSYRLKQLIIQMQKKKDEFEELDLKVTRLYEELIDEKPLNSPQIVPDNLAFSWNKSLSPKFIGSKFTSDDDNPRLSQLQAMEVSSIATPIKFPGGEEDDVDLYDAADVSTAIPNQVATGPTTMTASKGYNNNRLSFLDSTIKKNSNIENASLTKSKLVFGDNN